MKCGAYLPEFLCYEEDRGASSFRHAPADKREYRLSKDLDAQAHSCLCYHIRLRQFPQAP